MSSALGRRDVASTLASATVSLTGGWTLAAPQFVGADFFRVGTQNLDTNGDDSITPSDILAAINFINAQPAGTAEAESASPHAASVTNRSATWATDAAVVWRIQESPAVGNTAQAGLDPFYAQYARRPLAPSWEVASNEFAPASETALSSTICFDLPVFLADQRRSCHSSS